MQESPTGDANPDLRELPAADDEGNVAWIGRCGLADGVLLAGGSSLVDFRVRVAQSQLRSDLTPSYWSLCGLLLSGGTEVMTVPLQPPDISDVPRINAVQTVGIAAFDDPVAWPNVAVVRFADGITELTAMAERIRGRRTIIDLPALLLDWLAFGWAAGSADNPLLHARGLPSAAFVEATHALAGVELTPGLSSASSCPEAIWQSVKWWREYYEAAVAIGGRSGVSPLVPSGVYTLRQKSAAVALRPDAPLFIPMGGPGSGPMGGPGGGPGGPGGDPGSSAPGGPGGGRRP